jgi:hypothetical protein
MTWMGGTLDGLSGTRLQSALLQTQHDMSFARSGRR